MRSKGFTRDYDLGYRDVMNELDENYDLLEQSIIFEFKFSRQK